MPGSVSISYSVSDILKCALSASKRYFIPFCKRVSVTIPPQIALLLRMGRPVFRGVSMVPACMFFNIILYLKLNALTSLRQPKDRMCGLQICGALNCCRKERRKNTMATAPLAEKDMSWRRVMPNHI
jgi:hypothetical protein